MRVLDFGAARGAWFEEDRDSYPSQLRDMRSKVSVLVGCDVYPVVLDNKSLDKRGVVDLGSPLPFQDQEFDLIIAGFVFERLVDPADVAAEHDRILKPGVGSACELRTGVATDRS